MPLVSIDARTLLTLEQPCSPTRWSHFYIHARMNARTHTHTARHVHLFETRGDRYGVIASEASPTEAAVVRRVAHFVRLEPYGRAHKAFRTQVSNAVHPEPLLHRLCVCMCVCRVKRKEYATHTLTYALIHSHTQAGAQARTNLAHMCASRTETL